MEGGRRGGNTREGGEGTDFMSYKLLVGKGESGVG